MAEITYRELLTVIAQLVAATNAEAQAAQQRTTRIEAKVRDAANVGYRLVLLEFDEHTRRDVQTIADNFSGQAKKAVTAANAATDLNSGAQKAADTVRRNHGGIHNAVGSAPVAPHTARPTAVCSGTVNDHPLVRSVRTPGLVFGRAAADVPADRGTPHPLNLPEDRPCAHSPLPSSSWPS